jgi:hypothetical protein
VSLPGLRVDCQTTQNPPFSSRATEGKVCAFVVTLLIWKSLPSGTAGGSNQRAAMLQELLSVPVLPRECQTTRYGPVGVIRTEGNCWVAVVRLLTWNWPPSGTREAS